MRSALTSWMCAGIFAAPRATSRLDLEAEHRGEAHGAQHAQAILAEAVAGVADRAEHARLEIALAADVVDELLGERIEEKAVDREIAPLGVLLRRGKADVSGWRPSR